jgi:hypothetical protein
MVLLPSCLLSQITRVLVPHLEQLLAVLQQLFEQPLLTNEREHLTLITACAFSAVGIAVLAASLHLLLYICHSVLRNVLLQL